MGLKCSAGQLSKYTFSTKNTQVSSYIVCVGRHIGAVASTVASQQEGLVFDH